MTSATAAGARALPPAWVGMLFFVAAETMLFGGLLFAFVLFRLWSPVWPPLGEPRLPLGVTAVNTLVLLASAVTLGRARRHARAGAGPRARRALALTAALGWTFVAVQGSEWVGLAQWGVTAASGPYGGLVFALIGAHGVHVLGAVVWLLVDAVGGAAAAPPPARLGAGALYWYFVCALWLAIFAAVYL
ncbi:MAG: hypothetical protein A3E31_10620 [Candidatus Rokubacteria bacterium RIFCSPHIGHO2_12_FULL_73_22]|nr:MAG: hypothetical protein A3E31_10620 [Candidatus Rokubacteria bacterium RIFCSPHIGHO2_12_FULL_73_22]OGL00872.1 MAG: hypothetical protein A3D33_20950 [Candidatus Rokubacteria bacterium RIFCSPHIGHO2_02_FULL_73_26]OGL12619.1 MAG: hypothetical protein A3I14_00855 [Candidatus Rokubacteria bacterium RIFCSPLOWO2_02_FULL_73_56]OGL30126.1 MAG: hypothetical protein A3G44_00560 [Candidatus Rokubacteria bacterium RIFCSPLOWO2_12_FULL_73_47]